MLGLAPPSPAVGFSELLSAIQSNCHAQTKLVLLTWAGPSLKQVKSPGHLGVNSSFAAGISAGPDVPVLNPRFSGWTAPSHEKWDCVGFRHAPLKAKPAPNLHKPHLYFMSVPPKGYSLA